MKIDLLPDPPVRSLHNLMMTFDYIYSDHKYWTLWCKHCGAFFADGSDQADYSDIAGEAKIKGAKHFPGYLFKHVGEDLIVQDAPSPETIQANRPWDPIIRIFRENTQRPRGVYAQIHFLRCNREPEEDREPEHPDGREPGTGPPNPDCDGPIIGYKIILCPAFPRLQGLFVIADDPSFLCTDYDHLAVYRYKQPPFKYGLKTDVGEANNRDIPVQSGPAVPWNQTKEEYQQWLIDEEEEENQRQQRKRRREEEEKEELTNKNKIKIISVQTKDGVRLVTIVQGGTVRKFKQIKPSQGTIEWKGKAGK